MMYIFFTVVMLTKMRVLASFLQTSPYQDFLPFHQVQDLHIIAGKILLVDTWVRACALSYTSSLCVLAW
jgi:hypothetical protein